MTQPGPCDLKFTEIKVVSDPLKSSILIYLVKIDKMSNKTLHRHCMVLAYHACGENRGDESMPSKFSSFK